MILIKKTQFIYRNSSEGQAVSVENSDINADIFLETSELEGTTLNLFATRIYDIRWAARRYLRMCNRKGSICYYYSALYDDDTKDNEFVGSLDLSGDLAEKFFRSGKTEEQTNAKIIYEAPTLIKVLFTNYVNQIVHSEKGSIYEEQSEIYAPAVYMFKRWDRLKISDKNWIITEEPKLVFDYKGFLEGFKLTVKSLRSGIIDF